MAEDKLYEDFVFNSSNAYFKYANTCLCDYPKLLISLIECGRFSTLEYMVINGSVNISDHKINTIALMRIVTKSQHGPYEKFRSKWYPIISFLISKGIDINYSLPIDEIDNSKLSNNLYRKNFQHLKQGI